MGTLKGSFDRALRLNSLRNLIQKAIAIVKDGLVLDFEFESTNNPELDAASKKDLEKVKPNVQLPAVTIDSGQSAVILELPAKS